MSYLSISFPISLLLFKASRKLGVKLEIEGMGLFILHKGLQNFCHLTITLEKILRTIPWVMYIYVLIYKLYACT